MDIGWVWLWTFGKKTIYSSQNRASNAKISFLIKALFFSSHFVHGPTSMRYHILRWLLINATVWHHHLVLINVHTNTLLTLNVHICVCASSYRTQWWETGRDRTAGQRVCICVCVRWCIAATCVMQRLNRCLVVDRCPHSCRFAKDPI